MANGELDRCLTMGAFSAFIALSSYLDSHVGTTLDDAVEAIRWLNSDSSNLDFVGARLLQQRMGAVALETDMRFELRRIIKGVISEDQPWWLRLAPYGREKVRSALGQDQAQCFRDAGLFDPIPAADVIAWWDELASAFRSLADAERLARGREAEQLSLNYERKKIKELGIEAEPLWVSLDDNTLGYDIKSFDVVDGRVFNTLIEVKSAQADVIHVTRNEWNNAVTAGSNYLFHIWKMPAAQPMKMSVTEIDQHIPSDHGKGIWQEVKISFA